MLLEWKKAESFTIPLEVDYKSSRSSVFLRKNIDQQFAENETTKYIYDEAIITEPHFIYEDILSVDEYCEKLLNAGKEVKISELDAALEKKHQGKTSTLTFNLPASLQKGEDIKQVTSYKLLNVTSAGLLSTVLLGLNMLATSLDVPDSLVTDEGYKIIGLNKNITLNGKSSKQIAIIFAKYTELTGMITETYRMKKEQILNAQTQEELDDIIISFDEI